ncbi:PAS domain-containing protein [Roseomonas sp. PWR1]|uniref:histidine kinase n=1 Tax=Roseomonas nitratireducens TaxID=2820810 RepID=A0ABS4AV74_9PROT|nr:PAS domain-containing protein [Neoroseomonas nitratireducens]MBP0464681.1 PAS domain-containing protein [Neoroseomonas nitratireducens]
MSATAERTTGRTPALAGRLRGLVLACLLPLLVTIGLLAAMLLRSGAEDSAIRLASTARATAQAADAEIEGRLVALAGFAATFTTPPEEADLAALDGAARRLAQSLGSSVAILDRGLGLLVDTDHPFGTPLGSSPAVAAAIWAVETGRPRVSDILPLPGGATQAPALMVPVMRDGRPIGVVSAGLAPDRLRGALGAGRAVLLDGRGRIVAAQRTLPPELPDWPTLSSSPRGSALTGRDAGGRTIHYAVMHLSAAPDWRVVVWEPEAAAVGALGQQIPLAATLVLLALGIAGLAYRRTLTSVREPARALERHTLAIAEALRGDGAPPPAPAIRGPAEVTDIGTALAEAFSAAAGRERRLRALAEAGAIVLWRADAAGGWIEAAGWAGLTGQAAPAFRGDGWLEMVHPDDRAPTLAEWGRSLVARNPIGVEFRLRTADEAAGWRWVRATGVAVVNEDGLLLEWVGAIHDVADARGAGQAHRVNEAQVRQTVAELRAVYDTVPVGLALVDQSLKFVNVNARFAAISGLLTEAHIGRAAHEVMPEGLARPLEDAQRRVFATGRPVLDVTCSAQAPGAVQHLRHWLASCHPVKNAGGEVTGVSAVLQDVTDRVRAEKSREALVSELNHRVKNTLATVQSLAAQSLRGAGAAALGREFVGRLQALMRGHDLIADQDGDEVELPRVARAALSPWIESGKPIRVLGSGRILVSAAQVQALVLGLHELATNAARYGALSRPGGEVELSWTLGEDGVVVLTWQESGGPPVATPAPARRGFGMRLLERGLAHDLGPGAAVRVSFAEDGARIEMRFHVRQRALLAPPVTPPLPALPALPPVG